MLDFPAPKVMAKALRGALAERNISLTHAQCLDLVAKQLGFADWNVLAPRLDSGAGGKSLAIPNGWFPTGHSSADHFWMGVAPEMPGVAMVEARRGHSVQHDGRAHAVDLRGGLSRSAPEAFS